LELEREREREGDIEPFVNEFGTARDARIERERERLWKETLLRLIRENSLLWNFCRNPGESDLFVLEEIGANGENEEKRETTSGSSIYMERIV
jgi:hypothetical protein